MKYFAHTAEDENGKRLDESSGSWQPLAEHLANVAKLAAGFAAPFGASDEARLAGCHRPRPAPCRPQGGQGGGMPSTLIGSAILDKGLNQTGAHLALQYIIKGLVILGAVWHDVRRRK